MSEQQTPRDSAVAPYLNLMVTMVMFGSAFASSKVVVGSMPHQVAAALRFGGGAMVLLLVVVLLRRGAAPIGRATVLRAALVGIVGVFAYNVFFFWGLSLAPSLDGTIIVPVLSPVLTTVVMIACRRERSTWPQVLGLTLGAVGACVFLFGAGSVGDGSTRLVGDAIFVAAAACWAGYSILSKSVLGGVDPLRATAWGACAGALGLIIVAIPDLTEVTWQSLPTLTWLNVAFLAVGPTAIAYLFYFRGLRDVSPTVATVMMFTVPVIGSLCSFLFLGETLTGVQGFGAAVLLVGALFAVVGPTVVRRRAAGDDRVAAPANVH